MLSVQIGDYAFKIRRRILDQDGNVVDISSYTTRTFKLQKPDGTTVSRGASFTTTGSDGDIEYTTVSGDIDMAGAWEFQFVLSKTGAQLATPREKLNVKANI